MKIHLQVSPILLDITREDHQLYGANSFESRQIFCIIQGVPSIGTSVPSIGFRVSSIGSSIYRTGASVSRIGSGLKMNEYLLSHMYTIVVFTYT